MENEDPKIRIKAAALELFGDKGFKGTTIRDICKQADVSLALVNYHFRSKYDLYEQILIEAVSSAFEANPLSAYISEDMTPEEKLRNLIRLLMHRLFGDTGLGRTRSAVRLLAKELTNPSEVMDSIFDNYLSVMVKEFHNIIGDILNTDDKTVLMRFVSSIAGQCLHPLLAKDILARTGVEIASTREDIEKHAEHIYNFSLNGINGYYRGEK